MRCHEVDYRVLGDDLQLLEVELDTGETVIAEAGAMTYMEDGIHYQAKMGDGSKVREGVLSKILKAGGRILTGESLFLTHFTNRSGEKKRLGFAAPYPGKILALDMSQYDKEILCQKNAFLASAFGTKLSIAFHKKIMTGLFGGEGFILQKIEGDGMAFLHGGGTILSKTLAHRETLFVDTGCLMAFTRGVDYSVTWAGSLKSMSFGGEGLVLATLKGPGEVWLHSLPFSRLANQIVRYAPIAGGSNMGEGSIIKLATTLLKK